MKQNSNTKDDGLHSSTACRQTVVTARLGRAKATVYWYDDDKETIYFAGLFVEQENRKKGIGTYLQNICENIGISINAKSACLWVKKETWMHEWYQRRGYSDLKDHKQKGFVWMTKPLF